MGDQGQPERADALSLLLEVQQRDLLIDQLIYRRRELEERRILAEIEAQAAVLESRAAQLRLQSDELVKRQGDIEAHVETYTDRIATIEQRLRQGGGGYREVQAMSAETESLARHRRELEDREIEVMEELEPVGNLLVSTETELSELAVDRATAAGGLARAEELLDAEMAAVRAARGELAALLPAGLALTYEHLRERLGGIGAARLVDGICSGCHLQLPSSERERVLHAPPGELVFCDQCGRILVA
ncbi:MAG: zinc ribbon domain-containing protein [Acidimicrobiales bacterium]